ncbi:MAG: CoA transferase, partial [Candidatus Puniceispirillaceae bacterium]
HAGELVAEIEAELARRPATEWEAVLQQAGVPAARIRTLRECLASDQVRQRRFIHTDPASGVATPTLPFRIAGAASHAPGKPAPRLGEDTAEIMAWLEGGS